MTLLGFSERTGEESKATGREGGDDMQQKGQRSDFKSSSTFHFTVTFHQRERFGQVRGRDNFQPRL